MTTPDFQFTDSDTESNSKRRDPSEILDFKRICEIESPRGKRPGKLIIVRPLEKIKDWRETDPDMAWKTLVVADIAVLEGVPAAVDEFQNPIPPIAPGAMYRNQVVFPGMLCKAWRDQIGNTLIGVLYLGPNEKGQPPFLWRSLAKVQAATDLGRRFMMRFPNFLIPVPREPEAAAAAEQWTTDPWATPASPVPNQAQYATSYSDPYATTSPTAPAVYGGPQHQPAPDPWAHTQGHPAAREQQPDPWAQAPAAGVAPAQAAPAQHPGQGMSTIDQLKLATQQQNHQGAPQQGEPPF